MKNEQDEMLEEYDFTDGIRGKYAKEYSKGSNIVKIDKDLLRIFPDEKAINDALRGLAKMIEDQHIKSA